MISINFRNGLTSFTENDTIRECFLEGVKQHYDVCSTKKLSDAKKYYGKKYKYIGSSMVLFINGTKNNFEELYHFFVCSNDA